MKFLLVFGTGEGQTRKIAEFCAKHLSDAGHAVDLRDSNRRMPDLRIEDHDAVILAGSVHQKVHQESLTNFVVAHRSQLKTLPSLLISVSLSIAFENGEAEARRYVQTFNDDTGFEPSEVCLVAGALKHDQYDYYMSQVVEYVVLDNRGAITGDREFTDWNALGAALDRFAAST